MDKNQFYNQLQDPHVTPSGLFVSGDSFDSLIKAEAKKIGGDNEKAFSRLFSNFAFQNMAAWGAREKPIGTPSFPVLYESAKKSFIDSIIINARKDQVKSIWQRALDAKQKQIGFKVVHDRHDDPKFKGSDEINKRCREMEELLLDPTPEEYIDIYPHNVQIHNGLKDLVSRLMSAELIIDRKVIQRYPRRDGKGYAAFHWLPGETIKNVDESVREWATKNEPEGKVGKYTAEKMSYASGFDITRSAYVQMIDGMVQTAFTDDEISVHISNPGDRLNQWGYGESRLEISLDLTSTCLYAWSYNKELFKTDFPDSIITVSGDYDKAGLAAFKQKMYGMGGPGNWHRAPVISSGENADVNNFKVEAHKLRDTPKDMLFDTLIRNLIMLKCAAYGAHPTILNFSSDGGGSNAIFGHNPKDEIAQSKEHGLKPSLLDMCEWFTRKIIKPCYDDLKLIITGLDDEDENQVVELRTSRTSKWMTKNEARMEEGLEPIGNLKDVKNVWNYPADAPITTYMNVFDMEKQGGDGGFDDEDDDDEQQESDGPEGMTTDKKGGGKKVEKSQNDDVKFLRITLE